MQHADLRAYLKKLPDFEDVEAEDWAMRHALGFRNFSAALYFFHQWPDPAHAAQLVLDRASEIDGNAYYLLDPVARQIEGKHPLAATLLRRAMIDDTLEGAKSSRYKHAARHLLECQSLATMIRDYGTFETDEAFTSRLRASHARKTGFWKQVAEVSGRGPINFGHFAQLCQRVAWRRKRQVSPHSPLMIRRRGRSSGIQGRAFG